jgi:hypothetical protein
MTDLNFTEIAYQPELDDIAKPLSQSIVAADRNAGDVETGLKNAMRGVWLHHPHHPAPPARP